LLGALEFNQEHNMELAKVIAITGASSGIGEATARLLAAQGACVLIGARRMDRLEKIATSINAAGGAAEARSLDVTEQTSAESFVHQATARFGRLDVLVNNAGVMPLSPLDALKVDEWDRMIDVNIKGVLYGIAAALPVFKKQQSGHIINVSSIGAYRAVPTAAVYCATKSAVNFISEGFRQENPDIRCTIISPGVTESELATTITHPETADLIADYRRLRISPEQIAKAIAYAVEQPADVCVSEIVVRPTLSPN
jgi:NADP-dependent 3-hydroxy acid dehydrogenase YdfG